MTRILTALLGVVGLLLSLTLLMGRLEARRAETCRLEGSSPSGKLRTCTYRCEGGLVTIAIDRDARCPRTIRR